MATTQAVPMNAEQMAAMIAKLQADNERLRRVNEQPLRCKVSEKRALSVSGLGRWPVTLYKEQWLRLLDVAEMIREFIKAHDGELAAKGDDKPTV